MGKLYSERAFTVEECNKILEMLSTEQYKEFHRSKMFLKDGEDLHYIERPEFRRSDEQVFISDYDFAWIKTRITQHLQSCFEVYGKGIENLVWPQGYRFLRYNAETKDYQDWHNDAVKESRIYTCQVQLSDPNNYDGCELIFESPILSKQISRKQGWLNIFPSKYIHKVTECTSGQRYTLIMWAEEEGGDFGTEILY